MTDPNNAGANNPPFNPSNNIQLGDPNAAPAGANAAALPAPAANQAAQPNAAIP